MFPYALLDRALTLHLLPDPALLLGSRVGTRMRLRNERAGGVEAQEDRLRSLVWHLSNGPIAERPDARQPAAVRAAGEFFAQFLGPRPEVQLRALDVTRRDARAGRGGHARAHL